jgi:hypothetical protein
MRKLTFAAIILALLAGCSTTGVKGDYIAWQNADHRVWPPVVEGQAFPVQFLWDAN